MKFSAVLPGAIALLSSASRVHAAQVGVVAIEGVGGATERINQVRVVCNDKDLFLHGHVNATCSLDKTLPSSCTVNACGKTFKAGATKQDQKGCEGGWQITSGFVDDSEFPAKNSKCHDISQCKSGGDVAIPSKINGFVCSV